MYDTIIKNALVFDGTASRPFEADLALKGPTITEVGRLDHTPAATVIDAGGCAVAPGFIDMHSHADFSLPVQPTADSLLHQGITSAVVGQCGLSPAPLLQKTRQEVVGALGGFFSGVAQSLPWDAWNSFEEYLNFLAQSRVSLNVLPLVGQGVIRASVMGFAAGRANKDQMEKMKAELGQALDQGAIGLSTGLIYPPGSFTPTDELIELTRIVGRHGGFYFSHIRGEGDTLLEAVAEAIHIGRETGSAVQISHFKAARRSNWSKSARALELIHQAQSQGLDITADLYPYRAGSTSLKTLLPEWAHVGGPAETLRRLSDPAQRRRMKDAMQAGGYARGIDFKDVLITSSPRRTPYEGRSVSDLAATGDRDPYEWLFDALAETELDMSMAVFGMSEANRMQEIQDPGMMIGTDGVGLATSGPLARGVPHPRNYGAFPRVLGRFVRDLEVIKLEEAVHKMTGLPARKLRLADRGLINPGQAADLVVFDPATVADTATYDQPHQYAEGIIHVLVNGRFVVRDGAHTGDRPGKILKRSGGLMLEL